VIVDGENSIENISEEIKNKVCEYLEKKR